MGRYVTQGDGEGDIVPSLMAYVLVAQLTRDDSAATTIDTDVLDAHVATAEAEVDAYLGVRYALPLTTVPALVAKVAARRTRFHIYASRPGAIEEWLQAEYDRDEAFLKDVASGKRELGLTLAGADAGASQADARRVRSTSAAPVFGRTNMSGF